MLIKLHFILTKANLFQGIRDVLCLDYEDVEFALRGNEPVKSQGSDFFLNQLTFNRFNNRLRLLLRLEKLFQEQKRLHLQAAA